MDAETQAIIDEYFDLAHAMQTGVAYKMQYYKNETDPKHLRTGVNSALVDSSALAKLLMSKGIITELEYYTALRDGMKAEVDRYQGWLNDHFGNTTKITLK